MSLAATLSASGMRPASFLPTIKCSDCGQELEISTMGEHACSQAPASPKPVPASLNNPFTLRQMNASGNRPAQSPALQINTSVTKPLQASPSQHSASEPKLAVPSTFQFNANETKPAQPSPLQFDSHSSQSRPRAATGAGQLPAPRPPRSAPPRINPETANQPFRVPLPPTPLSPVSSVRSGSSNSSRNTQPKRSMTTPMPRLYDPRPPSPELSANLDCAFPPFPTAAAKKRKNSNASQASSRSGGLRPELYSVEPRSPLSIAGESIAQKLSGTRSEPSSRRPSNEHRSPQEGMSPLARPSQRVDPLTPLEEFPPPPPQQCDQPSQPAPSLPPSEPSAIVESPISPTSDSGLRGLVRKLSQKRLRPERPAIPEEPLPTLTIPAHMTPAVQPSHRKPPPQRPARPQEGLPDSLLSPTSLSPLPTLSPISPLFPSMPEIERSQTTPAPLSEIDYFPVTPQLSKMPSEPALRTKSSLTDAAHPSDQSRQDQKEPQSRLDLRLHDAPPVPKSVQLHRSESLHKSSESGTSTASSVLSLSNLSFGNSNTTACPSPVVSAASSLDTFSPFTADAGKDGEGDDLRVAALNVKPQQRPGSRAELPKDSHSARIAASPLAAEIVQPTDVPDDNENCSVTLSLPISPRTSTWPLESPMDPALNMGILGDTEQDDSLPSSPIEFRHQTLAPDSPKLERLSNAVYDPKRPFSPSSETEHEPESRSRSTTGGDIDFQGFNFGTAFSVQLEHADSAPQSEKASDSAPPTVSEPQQFQISFDAQPEPTDLPLLSRKTSDSASPLQVQDFDSAPSSRRPSDSAPSPVLESLQPQTSSLQVPEPLSIRDSNVQPSLARRSTAGLKPTCRGCSQRIEGKSVKAADGRLTGRWHKTCFVCQTCEQPFETADFYVINNHPYCEQHYHEKNGSVCHGCSRGIEGQFLETHSGPGGRVLRKYHPRCFTCTDCRMVLSEDYFEIAGRIHCERHALAAMRSQAKSAHSPAGSLALPRASSGLKAEPIKAERRRTRLLQT